MPRRFNCNENLCAHSIGARNEHWFSHARWRAKHPAKSAKLADGSIAECGCNQTRYPRFGFVRRGEVYTRTPVVERAGAHASSSSSNVVRRLSCRTRSSTSLRVSDINLSIEKFSTANEPSADPYITARLMLASLKSPVRVRYPMNPPANESPAPVGSNTLSSGYAGAKKTLSRLNISAPCSPFLMI